MILFLLVLGLAACDSGRWPSDGDYLALSRDGDDLVVVSAPCAGEIPEDASVFGEVPEGSRIYSETDLGSIPLTAGFGEVGRARFDWSQMSTDSGPDLAVEAVWTTPDSESALGYWARYKAPPDTVAVWPDVTRFDGTVMTVDEFLDSCDGTTEGAAQATGSRKGEAS